MTIELCTGSGELVGMATIPMMIPMPEIVCWGERWFIHDGGRHSTSGLYVEGLVWFVHSVHVGKEVSAPQATPSQS